MKNRKLKSIGSICLSMLVVLGTSGFAAEASEMVSDGNTKSGGYEWEWVVQPEIEADNVYYLAPYPDMQHALNTLSKQADNSSAVIEKDGQLGIIDINGNMLTDIAYKEMANFGTNYKMISTVPQYSDLFGGDWDIYWLTQDGVRADVDNGSLNLFMYYYYQGSRQRAGSGMEETTEVIPVQESQSYIDFPTGDFLRELDNSKYALDNNGSLVTDFIYDECGSLSDGLFAVCQDGKWGYVDEQGNIVIPVEYDASWKQYPIFNMSTSRSSNEVKDYCYAASDGYVVLCSGEEWEIRDTSGNSVIPGGEFEAIRPVFDGRCWVKKDGKWGVIQVNKTGAFQDISVLPGDGSITDYPEYDEIIRKYYDGISAHWTMQEFSEKGLDYLACYVENVADFGYYLADVDQNGTEELLLGVLAEVTPGYTGMFYDLYTMEDGKLAQIITSGERDRYYLCEDNTIANEGSGSAWTSSHAYYDLVGSQLYIKELVRFDAYYDENNPWFYSATGDWSDYSSPITEEAANSIINSYEYRGIPYISLSVLE